MDPVDHNIKWEGIQVNNKRRKENRDNIEGLNEVLQLLKKEQLSRAERV